MTRDELEVLAGGREGTESVWVMDVNHLARFAAAIIERCAVVAERVADQWAEESTSELRTERGKMSALSCSMGARDTSAAIRAEAEGLK